MITENLQLCTISYHSLKKAITSQGELRNQDCQAPGSSEPFVPPEKYFPRRRLRQIGRVLQQESSYFIPFISSMFFIISLWLFIIPSILSIISPSLFFWADDGFCAKSFIMPINSFIIPIISCIILCDDIISPLIIPCCIIPPFPSAKAGTVMTRDKKSAITNLVAVISITSFLCQNYVPIFLQDLTGLSMSVNI